MKRIIYTITAAIIFILQGCNDNNGDFIITSDYGCYTSYQIENKSDNPITIIRVYGYIANGDGRDELSNTISISPGEKKEVYRDGEMCGENTAITEWEGEKLPIILQNISVNVYADNRLLNKSLLSKNNWVFSAEKYYHATYYLVLTDALIERVRYVEE